MSVPVKLRDDFSAVDVRAHARRCKDGAQVRRLLAIATILDGDSRSDAAPVGGVTRQIVRDWVLRFNADGPERRSKRSSPARFPGRDSFAAAMGLLWVRNGGHVLEGYLSLEKHGGRDRD